MDIYLSSTKNKKAKYQANGLTLYIGIGLQNYTKCMAKSQAGKFHKQSKRIISIINTRVAGIWGRMANPVVSLLKTYLRRDHRMAVKG